MTLFDKIMKEEFSKFRDNSIIGANILSKELNIPLIDKKIVPLSSAGVPNHVSIDSNEVKIQIYYDNHVFNVHRCSGGSFIILNNENLERIQSNSISEIKQFIMRG